MAKKTWIEPSLPAWVKAVPQTVRTHNAWLTGKTDLRGRGFNTPQPVVRDGKTYQSVKTAARATGFSEPTIKKRARLKLGGWSFGKVPKL